ncbi:YrzQ family protein [Bacillus sp. Marseille-P3661]|nr:YrzQ family protein [Bacillus sp. Marseille-P3661]
MNRTMTSLVALGIGAVAYNMARGNNNMFSARNMKKMRKRITKAF